MTSRRKTGILMLVDLLLFIILIAVCSFCVGMYFAQGAQ